ncbi:MAG: 10 kDa chaperonin [uncultured bacterium (gcode 4)]|uniref:10 kDa chaperonin n=1 Tax=uncultured bacterium (gcode 4) TaxID=1234023 RepID=K2AY94_9BACT|nr:MAG: 10 kDa chaperonin [uncultured bacterium (gcode 4)]
MIIKPLSDRVLLKWLEAENITKSGIYIPENSNKDRPYMYEVIAVGPGKEVDWKLIKIELNPWDKVISWQYSGDDIEIDWKKFKIVAADYILAKMEG